MELTFEQDIFGVKHNMSKFHEVLFKIPWVRDPTSQKKAKFHEQRAMTPEGI